MKKHHILLALLLVVVGVLAVVAIYKYNRTPKGLTYQQVVNQRDVARSGLAGAREISQNDDQAIQNLTADKTALTSQKATLCAQIAAAKLKQPLCQ